MAQVKAEAEKLSREEARRRGWLSPAETVAGLPITWRTVRLLRQHRVIPLSIRPLQWRRQGARGGTETLWPPELRQILTDICTLRSRLTVRGHRLRTANGQAASRHQATAASYSYLRLALRCLEYGPYPDTLIKDSWGTALQQAREQLLTPPRWAKESSSTDGPEEALQVKAQRRVGRLYRIGSIRDNAPREIASDSLGIIFQQAVTPDSAPRGDKVERQFARVFTEEGSHQIPESYTLRSILKAVQTATKEEIAEVCRCTGAFIKFWLFVTRNATNAIKQIEGFDASETSEMERDILADCHTLLTTEMKSVRDYEGPVRNLPVFMGGLLVSLRARSTMPEVNQQLEEFLSGIGLLEEINALVRP